MNMKKFPKNTKLILKKPQALNFQSLRDVKDNFRILKNWRIRLKTKGPYYGQITSDVQDKTADLWDWPYEDERPDDFFIHECLHVAIRELKTLRGEKRYNAEEYFIQDICWIVRLFTENKKTRKKSDFYESRMANTR